VSNWWSEDYEPYPEEKRRTIVDPYEPPKPRDKVERCPRCGCVSAVRLDVLLFRTRPIRTDGPLDRAAAGDDGGPILGHSETLACFVCGTRQVQREGGSVLYAPEPDDRGPAFYMIEGRGG